MNDPVNHPKHYTSHPSGIECIEITRHMGFNVGNAVKYLWRADEKGNAVEDLKKAIWYINDEINKRTHLIANNIVNSFNDQFKCLETFCIPNPADNEPNNYIYTGVFMTRKQLNYAGANDNDILDLIKRNYLVKLG